MHTKQHFFKIATNKNSKNYDLGGKKWYLDRFMIILPTKIAKFHSGIQTDRISHIANIYESITRTIKNMESALEQKI